MLVLRPLNLESDTEIPIKEGFKIGAKHSNLPLPGLEALKESFVISCDSSGNFSLVSPNAQNAIFVGEDRSFKVSLLPGLIFKIAQTTFAVEESDQLSIESHSEEQKLTAWQIVKNTQIKTPPHSSIYILKKPISLDFVRGPLINSSWSVPYLPMSFGLESLIYFFIDEQIPSHEDFLKLDFGEDLSQGSLHLSSSLKNFVSVNSQPLNQTREVSHEDLIEFGSTAFYIRF